MPDQKDKKTAPRTEAELQAEIEALKANLLKEVAENEEKGKELLAAKEATGLAEAESLAMKKVAKAAEAELQKKLAQTESEVNMQERILKSQLAQQKKVRILIASGQSQAEQCPVTLGLNGTEYLILRDVPVDVPEGLLNVLQDCKVSSAFVEQIENGQKRTVFKDVPRFSFQVLGHVNPETGELSDSTSGV